MSLSGIEDGDGVIECRDLADVRPQPSVTHPLGNLAQLRTIGLDDKVDRQAVGRPRLDWPDDGYECSSGSNQSGRPLPDVAADEIQHQINFAYVLQPLVAEVDKLVRAEIKRFLSIRGTSGTDHVSTSLTRELCHH
jgi:hypothetical protein